MSELKEPIKIQSVNIKIKNNKNNLSYKNKNDTFYLFIKTFHSIDNFFLFLYSYVPLNLSKITNKKIFCFKKLFFITFFFSLLFSLVLNENINISTDLLINAYFNDSEITHISYDNMIKKKHEEGNNIYNSNNQYIYNNNQQKNCQRCNNYQEIYSNNDYCKKRNNNKSEQYKNGCEIDTDFYFLKFFPVKCIFVTCFCFFTLYIIIKTTYSSRIKNSIFINIIGIYTSFKILSYLYSIKYYLASGFIFILFFYFVKSTIDSFYLILKIRRSDFEIFSTSLSAMNCKQFILKLIILLTGAILSGFLSIFYFQFYFNYIIFYISLFTFIILYLIA